MDVFAFGVVLYELLSRNLVTCWRHDATAASGDDGDDDGSGAALLMFAQRVANGYRLPFPSHFPPQVCMYLQSRRAQREVGALFRV